MGSSTAAFFEPYTDDPGNAGLLIHDPANARAARRSRPMPHGFQPVVHAIGDRANTLVLDIFERLHAPRGAPARVAAAPRARAGRPARGPCALLQTLGVIASLQPSHCIDDMRWAERRIGRGAVRAGLQRPLVRRRRRARGVRHRLVRRAARPDARPLCRRHAAVRGRHAGRRLVPRGARHARAGGRVLYAGSAYAEFTDDRKGQLKPGYLADLVILSRDIFTVAPREILETRPVLTMVGGRVVFDAGALERRGWARAQWPHVAGELTSRPMRDLIIILRTPSQIEADVIKGLLETHGIEVLVTSNLSRTAFPFSSNELRLSVSDDEAERAKQIIDSHRDEVGPGARRAVRQRARAARAHHRLPLSRSRPARARADAPLARARGRERRRHRQRVAGVPRRLGPRVRDRRHALSRVPAAQRRAEVEAQGVDRVGDVARPPRRAHRPRRAT